MLKNATTLAIRGVDTEENGPRQVSWTVRLASRDLGSIAALQQQGSQGLAAGIPVRAVRIDAGESANGETKRIKPGGPSACDLREPS